MKAIDDTDGMAEVTDADYDPVRAVAKSMDVKLQMFVKKDKKARPNARRIAVAETIVFYLCGAQRRTDNKILCQTLLSLSKMSL